MLFSRLRQVNWSQPCLGGLAVSHLRISNHARVLILVVLGTMSCSRGSCLHVNVLHCLASSSYSHTGCDSPRSLVHPAFPVFLIPSAIVHRSISSEDCQVNNASFMFSIFVHVPILRRSSFTFPFFIDLRSRSRSSFALSGTRSLDSSYPTVRLTGARL